MSRLPSGYKRAHFLVPDIGEREWFISVRNENHARCPECSGLTARGPGCYGPPDVEHRTDCARYPSRLQRERAEADALAERQRDAWKGLGLRGPVYNGDGRLSVPLEDAEFIVSRLGLLDEARRVLSLLGPDQPTAHPELGEPSREELADLVARIDHARGEP